MIVENNNSEALIIGDTSRNKVSIDINNINFITTLLSSNLYSEPLKSFLRETVSNAWDSHIEAHKEDVPVIIRIKDNSITIRDFGVGLSPERFKEIYLNIGSSTKRGDNTQIGGFGIGRFSALACSNVVTINSYYDGTLYNYLMIKEGNSVNIDLINSMPTDQENGVEVSISNISSLSSNLDAAIRPLVFFPNIYIVGECEYINESKIEYHDTYAISTIGDNYKILLGNVLYPLNASLFGDYRRFILEIPEGVALRFNIGDLEVTPNRENIIYSKKTINKIIDKLDKFKSEICNATIERVKGDYNSLFELFNKLEDSCNKVSIYLGLGEDKYYSSMNISYEDFIPYLNENDILYKGKPISDIEGYSKLHTKIRTVSKPGLLAIYEYGIFHKDEMYLRRSWKMCNRISHPESIEISKDTKLSPVVKEYIASKLIHEEAAICHPFNVEEFRKKMNTSYPSPYMDDFVDSYIYEYNQKKTIIDTESEEFKEFKLERRKENSIKNENNTKTIEVEYYDSSSDYNYAKYDSFNGTKKYIEWANSTKNTGVIITNKRNENKELFIEIARVKKYKIIFVNKNILEFNNQIAGNIPTEGLLDPNKGIVNDIYCSIKLKAYPLVITEMQSFLMGNSLFDKVLYMNEINKKVAFCPHIRSYLLTEKFEDIKINPYIEHCAEITKEYNYKVTLLSDLVKKSGINYIEYAPAVTAFFIMKYKLFRIPYLIYKNYKDCPIFKTRKL